MPHPNLPDLHGYEVCRRIRSNPESEWEAIAVILQTGSQPVSLSDVEYDAFLTYPIDTKTLVVTIAGSTMRRRKV
ncbi:PleD family two-component system response regulator [Acidicapsa acidisoli]|uniref:hypothetical protein n=1 Tax=Acidicapsa acidisoli TaxID=1615681 RepID=UPI0021E07F6B|nr:hypothetical protein [Acidicapsa acidisoli]